MWINVRVVMNQKVVAVLLQNNGNVSVVTKTVRSTLLLYQGLGLTQPVFELWCSYL